MAITNKELEVIVKSQTERLDALTPYLEVLKEIKDTWDDEKSGDTNNPTETQTQTRPGVACRYCVFFIAVAVFCFTYAVVSYTGLRVEFAIGRFAVRYERTVAPPDKKTDPDIDKDDQKKPEPTLEETARQALTQVEKAQNFEAEKKKMLLIYQSAASQIRSKQIKSTSSARNAIPDSVRRSTNPPFDHRWDKFLETMGTATGEFIGATDTLDRYAECYDLIAKGLN